MAKALLNELVLLVGVEDVCCCWWWPHEDAVDWWFPLWLELRGRTSNLLDDAFWPPVLLELFAFPACRCWLDSVELLLTKRLFEVSLVPGPALASTTWCQCLTSLFSGESFFHLLTSKTQALQISPPRFSLIRKQRSNSASYFLLSVKRDDDDLALQIQHPKLERYIFGLWKLNISVDCS